jgi:hypothetical protein
VVWRGVVWRGAAWRGMAWRGVCCYALWLFVFGWMVVGFGFVSRHPKRELARFLVSSSSCLSLRLQDYLLMYNSTLLVAAEEAQLPARVNGSIIALSTPAQTKLR